MLESEIKEMLSIDIYNILLSNSGIESANVFAHVLKERGETDLLYSLYINN